MGTQRSRRAPPDRQHYRETHTRRSPGPPARKTAKFTAANCLASGTVPLTWQTDHLRTWARTQPQTAILSAAENEGFPSVQRDTLRGQTIGATGHLYKRLPADAGSVT